MKFSEFRDIKESTAARAKPKHWSDFMFDQTKPNTLSRNQQEMFDELYSDNKFVKSGPYAKLIAATKGEIGYRKGENSEVGPNLEIRETVHLLFRSGKFNVSAHGSSVRIDSLGDGMYYWMSEQGYTRGKEFPDTDAGYKKAMDYFREIAEALYIKLP